MQVEVHLHLVALCHLCNQFFQGGYFGKKGLVFCLELTVQVEPCGTCSGIAENDAVGVDHRYDQKEGTEYGGKGTFRVGLINLGRNIAI